MILTALDPGGTTGLCTISTDGNEFSWAQLTSLNDVWRYLTVMQPDIIIYERFDRTERYAELVACEVIGIIKLYHEQKGIAIHPQSRSIKKFWDNVKMKKVGAYCVGQPHATDAARHLLNYIVNVKKDYSYLTALRSV